MVIGIKKDQWAEVPEPEGRKIVPAGVGVEFEITDVREGHTDSGGKRGPHDFVQVVCTHTTDDGEAIDHWEYLALVESGLPWIKKMCLGIGRADILESEDAEWSELIGTQFACDVSHKKVNGETRSNLLMDTLQNLSHDTTELGDGGSGEEEDNSKGKKDKRPARPARGRAGR